MICIVGTRRSGKSSALIKVSEQTGLPIVTENAHVAHAVQRQALRMGADIPKPYARPFATKSIGLRGRVLVDEAQMILEEHIGLPVEVCTFDASSFDFSNMSLIEILAAWWRSRHVQIIPECEVE